MLRREGRGLRSTCWGLWERVGRFSFPLQHRHHLLVSLGPDIVALTVLLCQDITGMHLDKVWLGPRIGLGILLGIEEFRSKDLCDLSSSELIL